MFQQTDLTLYENYLLLQVKNLELEVKNFILQQSIKEKNNATFNNANVYSTTRFTKTNVYSIPAYTEQPPIYSQQLYHPNNTQHFISQQPVYAPHFLKTNNYFTPRHYHQPATTHFIHQQQIHAQHFKKTNNYSKPVNYSTPRQHNTGTIPRQFSTTNEKLLEKTIFNSVPKENISPNTNSNIPPNINSNISPTLITTTTLNSSNIKTTLSGIKNLSSKLPIATNNQNTILNSLNNNQKIKLFL